jgi:hypothetical protein
MISMLHRYSVATEERAKTQTVKPCIKVDPKINEKILSQVETEGLVIVHCSFEAIIGNGIRIWHSTFPVDKLSWCKSKLLHAFNIPFALTVLPVKSGDTARFNLIFSLTRSCKAFDLIEIAKVFGDPQHLLTHQFFGSQISG